MQKIQIWSNVSSSEFAIRLNTDIIDSFRAVTKQEEQYVRIVEETEYMPDMKYEWNYTLKYWIDTHLKGRINTTVYTEIREGNNLLPSHSTANDYENNIFSRDGINNNILTTNEKFSNSAFLGSELSSDGKKKSSKRKRKSGLKTRLKCHYCGLMFSDEIDRTGHEKEWHVDKVRKEQ